MNLFEQGIKNYINAYSNYMAFMQLTNLFAETMVKSSSYYLTEMANVYNVNTLPQSICGNPKR